MVEVSCRYWYGLEGNRRLNHCYYFSVFGVGSTECLCDSNLCNQTNHTDEMGLATVLLLLSTLVMGWI